MSELPTITTPGGNTLQITGYNAETGEVSYSYTLNNAKTHDAGEDDLEQSFAIFVQDLDGSDATSDLTVQILDDAPIAVDDSDSVAAGEFTLEEEGNLLENDQQGADGARITDVDGTEVPAEGTVDITGEYGVLTVAADGTYSYVRNEGTPGGVSDSFTYTLTDSDDDTDTATLTINIGDAPVTIDNPAETDGFHVVVNEAWLPDGTATGEGDLTQSGSFTVTAPDGVQTLTVGGEAIVADGEVVSELPTITTESGNTLVITGYTANGNGGYTVTYEYTLSTNKDHEQPDNDESLTQSFEIVLEDTDGDSASSNLTVKIIDDEPEFGTPEDVSLGLQDGSTVTGDLDLTIGADLDGAQISSASLFSDGQGYVQVRYEEGGEEATTYLTSGGKKLVFEFDVEDQKLIAFKEGDTSSDPVLTIDMSVDSNQYVVNVHQPLDAVAKQFQTDGISHSQGGISGSMSLSEENLDVSFTAKNGSVNWSNNSIGVNNPAITGSQELTAQFNQFLAQLTVKLPSQGNQEPGAVGWTVFNTETGQETSGNGLTVSADFSFNKVTFSNNGSGGSYGIGGFAGEFLDAELDFTLPVDVVAVDGDGDTTNGSFDISFEPDAAPELPELPTILGLTDSDITVNEKYLEGGTAQGDGDASDMGSFILYAPEGVEALLIAGTMVSGDGEQQGDKVKLSLADLQALTVGNSIVIETPQGNTLTLTGYDAGTGEVSYNFELGGAVDHDDGEDRNELAKEGIQLELVDDLGNIAYGSVDVVIIDDVPGEFEGSDVIQVPISEVIVGDWAAGWININTTNGQFNAEDLDSDDFKDLISWGTPAGGSEGSNYVFEDNEDLRDLETGEVDQTFVLGTFTHNNFPIFADGGVLQSVDLTMEFTIVIDGVPTQVTHTINIEHDETPNYDRWGNPLPPEEAADIVTISNATTQVSIEVGDREYLFEILGFKRVGEPDGEPVSEVITFEDASNSFELVGRISSTDDLPVLSGQIEDPFWGADGPDEDEPLLWSTTSGEQAVAEGETLSIEGQYGTLIVSADGSYTYEVSRDTRDTMNIGEDKEDVFTYYLQDADGDRVPSTLTITLEGAVNSIELDSQQANAEINSETVTPDPVPAGSIEGGGTIQTAWNTHGNGVEDTWESETFTVDEGGKGSFSFTAELSSPGSSSASLAWHLEKKDGNGEWQPVEGVGGAVGSGTHSVEDLESGEYQAVFEAEASGRSGNFLFGYSYPSVSVGGLDSEFQPDIYEELSISPFDGNVLAGATPGSINSTLSVKLPGGEWQEIGNSGLTLEGDYGSLVIQKDGSYVYTPEANADFVGESEAFELKLTHPAGESVTATLTIEIGGNAQPTGNEGPELQATGFGLFALEDLEALESQSGDDPDENDQAVSSDDALEGGEEEVLNASDEEQAFDDDEDSDEDVDTEKADNDLDQPEEVDDSEESIPVVADSPSDSNSVSEPDDEGSVDEKADSSDLLTASELLDESEELLKGEGSESAHDNGEPKVDDLPPAQVHGPSYEEINTSTNSVDQ
ncbi:choice-of-anchor K domain-containing protein [Halomonas sp. ANAO-440]|uniref:BapA/Bap/LapF family large adhesin n=1 Tax=Halomonas sp. ANAO-440 TaxID=2861360 RepID=UPI001CAA4B2C|nr:BapA/Bap/LapF family large adhesin [Halomonas sp. ANAO-440]MBZ0331810.1 choice-of-anchor K domain-containing protein [Halomonas sp. ANAO-440]